MTEWVRVKKSNPCVCCGRPDWCSYTHDGVVHCMRVQSDRPVKTGGWIHKLNGQVAIVDYLKKTAKVDATKLTPREVTELATRMYQHPMAEQKRAELANRIGVCAWALDRLTVGYWSDHRGEFASFPSRDEHGAIIGITRRYADGAKLTYPGTSNSGLFYDVDWADSEAACLFIVEGASDVAACMSEGMCAIGRPSNIGGAKRIASMIKAARWSRPVVVVGERDAKPERRGVVPGCAPDCRCCPQCYPGFYGAKKVAAQLSEAGIRATVKMPVNAKDVREMYNKQELSVWA